MVDPACERMAGWRVLSRLYWLVLGNVLGAGLLFTIVEKRVAFPSVWDVAFVLSIVSLIVVRYVDIRHFKGETCFGEPSTMDHWRRYACLTGLAGLGGELVARILVH